jgi:hypothetical protein
MKNNNFSFLFTESDVFYQPEKSNDTVGPTPCIMSLILRDKNFNRFRKRKKPENNRLSVLKNELIFLSLSSYNQLFSIG